MIQIIVGTDRPQSKSLELARFVSTLYQEANAPAEVLDIRELNLTDVNDGEYYKGAKGTYRDGVEKVTAADGLLMIVPEYNGSFPGALKLFIDYWRYPDTFENRPVAFIGLGGRWGGLRPVEHLQQVFGYRNAFVFPHRVFLTNVKDSLQNGQVTDKFLLDLLKMQTVEFVKYIRALKSECLDANSKKK